MSFNLLVAALLLVTTGTTYCDAPTEFQFNIQDPASPVAEGVINFHNNLITLMIGIATFVFYIIIRCLVLFHESKNAVAVPFIHNSVLEIVWTLIPGFIVAAIAVPSFALLYATEELIDPETTVKVIGHQWYWSYELNDYSEFKKLNFDSYMLPEEDLPVGYFRNLEVDNRLVLPILTRIRVLVTSVDVIHSWAVPSLAIKLDATPGRLLQTPLFIKRASVFYGQCSEICGVNHGFMPIVVVGLHPAEHFFYLIPKLGLNKLEATWAILADTAVPSEKEVN
jgi:heme/copper-type cytochrome/quinol oxidase subunit 2